MLSKLFIAQFAPVDVKCCSCFWITEVYSLLSVPVIHRMNHQNEAFNRFHATFVHMLSSIYIFSQSRFCLFKNSSCSVHAIDVKLGISNSPRHGVCCKGVDRRRVVAPEESTTRIPSLTEMTPCFVGLRMTNARFQMPLQKARRRLRYLASSTADVAA